MKFWSSFCVIFAIGVISMILGKSDGLKCYDCESWENKTCSDKLFPSKKSPRLARIPVIDCDASCVKHTYADGRVTRGCSSNYSMIGFSTDSEGCRHLTIKATNDIGCFCTEDLCNEAGTMKFATIVLTLVSFIGILSQFHST